MGNIGPGAGAIGGYQDLPSYLHDIPEYVHQSSLGGGKVLKTLQCLHDEGFVVVKIYIKRDKELQLKKYQLKMDELREKFALHEQPGVICLQKVDETDKAAYLVRQYFAYNLYDRFHTHPFLADIEKKWFAFQLLTAVTQMHGVGVRHGDIKTENIMVTSWNWCFLTDIAFYKPTFLPADNPADQQLYFDAGQRRRCYLAPERFYIMQQDKKAINSVQMKAAKGAGGSDGQVTEAMDIFSAGCVIAEIFLEGEAIFDLPQLLSYREGKYDPSNLINKIPDKHVRELVTHMIQRDATLRLSAKGYLQQFTDTVFPKYFSFLYKFFAKLLYPELADPDIKIQAISQRSDVILREIVGIQNAAAPSSAVAAAKAKKQNSISAPAGQAPPATPTGAAAAAGAAGAGAGAAGNAPSGAADPKSPAGPGAKNVPAPATPKTAGAQDVKGVSGAAPSTPISAAAAAAPTARGGLTAYASPPAAGAAAAAAAGAAHNALSGVASPSTAEAKGTDAAPRRSTKEMLDELEKFTKGLQAMTRVRPEDPKAAAAAAAAAAQQAAAAAKLNDSKSAISAYIEKSMADSKGESGSGSSSAPLRPLNIELNSLEATQAYYDELCKRITPVKDASFPTAPAEAKTPKAAKLESKDVKEKEKEKEKEVAKGSGAGLTMILSVICSCIQNVRYPLTKLTALDLLMEFGAYVDDDVALGRIVPYIVSLLSDTSSIVRATAVRGLTKTLARVQSLAQADAHIFPEYILPSLSRFPSDPEELVRLAYAQCIAQLAETARRFLDLSQYTRQVNLKALQAQNSSSSTTDGAPVGGAMPSAIAGTAGANAAAMTNYQLPSTGSYDQELAMLQDTVLKLVIDMATSGGAKVKRSLLTDITRLCVFMGRRRVNNELLPHLITVLNSNDWQLRAAFFEHVVGVSVFVGRKAFQNFVLPCMEQALIDVEEFVVQRTVHALAALVQLGLFERKTMLDTYAKVVPLTCHPSTWIRNESISFIVAAADRLGLAKAYCMMLPQLKPFLRYDLIQLTRESLVHCLKPPLTRREFQNALRPDSKASQQAAAAVSGAAPSGASGAAAGAAGAGPASGSNPPGAAGAKAAAADDAAHHHTLATAAAVALGGGDRSEVSMYSTDNEFAVAMNRYLGRLAQMMQSKSAQDSPAGDAGPGASAPPGSVGVPVGGVAMAAGGAGGNVGAGIGIGGAAAAAGGGDDEDMERYLKLDEEIPTYSIEIQQTAPDNGQLLTPIDRLQQDLFESLGVQVQLNENAAARAQPRYNNTPSNESLQARLNNSSQYPAIVPENKRNDKSKPAVKQALEKVPEYIQKALSIPPPPPNLGVLRGETISTSAFYKNHHCLDMPSIEPVEPRNWRPKGVLVATLHEHKESCNTLAVSRDNLFLVSGSDDGTVRVWDCQRFKLTANARSQLTYTMRGRVSTTCVLDSCHSVACGNDLGQVHVFKVEYVSKQDENAQTRYAGMSTVKNFDDVNEGAILGVEHFNTLTESMFVYGTMRGRLHGHDLRAKAESFNFTIEPSMGLLSAMAIGPTPFCLVAGTTRGFVVLWDLRFQVPVQIWRHNAKTRIVSITPQEYTHIVPAKRLPPPMAAGPGNAGGGAGKQAMQGPLMFIAAEGTNEVVGFDVYTGECRLVFRVSSNVKGANPGPNVNLLESAVGKGKKVPIQPVASGKPGAAAAGAGAGAAGAADDLKTSKVSPLSLPSLRSYLRTEDGLPSLDDQFVRELGVTATTILGRTEREDELLSSATPASISGFLCCRENYVVTAGSDRVVRYWDLREPVNSYRISSDRLGAFNIRYTARFENNTLVYEEVLSTDADAGEKPGSGGGSVSAAAVGSGGNSGAQAAAAAAAAGGGAGGAGGDDAQSNPNKQAMHKRYGPVPPVTAHHEEIVDLRAIEFPVKMLATCSRDGAVKIWV